MLKSSVDLVEAFNQMQGRLRVSVTHACQLRCQFCHREGIAEHWKPIAIAAERFDMLISAYRMIGGLFVEITGGEPTLHPSLADLLTMAQDAGCLVILHTNGLRLDRVSAALRRRPVHLVRISLHHGAGTPDRARRLLGTAWDFDRLAQNVAALRSANVPVQLIFTHTRENQAQLEPVLRSALEWRTDVQVVDLIRSRVADPAASLGYVPGQASEDVVGRFAELERTVADRTGAILKLFRAKNGTRWEVKDYHFGVLHSGMCSGCTLRPHCGEGIYALRVDALGAAKPCLLREDLESQLFAGEPTTQEVASSLRSTIERMLDAPLEWSYDDHRRTQR